LDLLRPGKNLLYTFRFIGLNHSDTIGQILVYERLGLIAIWFRQKVASLPGNSNLVRLFAHKLLASIKAVAAIPKVNASMNATRQALPQRQHLPAIPSPASISCGRSARVGSPPQLKS
jgi:hypothetical protein